jgi:CheY-like chemotaxis protein
MMTPKSILVLEDDLKWQMIVSGLLKKVDRQLQIQCVPTTQEAIDLLQNGQHFDLVVADHFLDDGMTGLDLYKHMRALKDQTSFVIFSGQETADFHDLNTGTSDLPKFVSKLHAFSMFNEAVRDEIATAVIPVASVPIANDARFALLVISALAVAYALSNSLTITETSHANRFKSPVFIQKQIPQMQIPTTVIPLQQAPLNEQPPKNLKKREFLNPKLLSSVKRIVKRADAIDAEVSRQ